MWAVAVTNLNSTFLLLLSLSYQHSMGLPVLSIWSQGDYLLAFCGYGCLGYESGRGELHSPWAVNNSCLPTSLENYSLSGRAADPLQLHSKERNVSNSKALSVMWRVLKKTHSVCSFGCPKLEYMLAWICLWQTDNATADFTSLVKIVICESLRHQQRWCKKIISIASFSVYSLMQERRKWISTDFHKQFLCVKLKNSCMLKDWIFL